MIGDVLAPTHLLLILIVALVVLGPKRLPEVGRSLGKGLRDFKDAVSSYTPDSLLSDDYASVRTPTQPVSSMQTATPPPRQEHTAATEAQAPTPASTTQATVAGEPAVPSPHTAAPLLTPSKDATEVLPAARVADSDDELAPVDAEVVERQAG